MADEKNGTYNPWSGSQYSGLYGAYKASLGQAAPTTTGEWLSAIDLKSLDLPEDALPWLISLAKFGEWVVPGAGKQNVGEWINFLGTEQGKGWWGSLTPQAKSTLMPDYGSVEYRGVEPSAERPAVGQSKTALEPIFTEGGPAGPLGAAQRGSTFNKPVLSLPWLQNPPQNLPSAEHQYGVPTGGGNLTAWGRQQKQYAASLNNDARIRSFMYESLIPGLGTRRVAPPARWLMY